MSDLAAKRIQKELAAMLDDPPSGCSLLQMGDDVFRWKVQVQGPPDSPFEGSTFTLLVVFPKTYPFKPPKVKFETRIFHPNINQSGDICLDTLSSQWVPSISMAQVMLSITLLLSNPNPSDPINMEAARLLRNDPEEYNRRVRTMSGRRTLRTGIVRRQARSEVGGRQEEGVAGPDVAGAAVGEVEGRNEEEVIAGEAVGEQAAEQEEEDRDEVGADAAEGGEAHGEVNNVLAAEVMAEDVDPADEEANSDEETAAAEGVVAEGVDPAEDENGDEENAEERA